MSSKRSLYVALSVSLILHVAVFALSFQSRDNISLIGPITVRLTDLQGDGARSALPAEPTSVSTAAKSPEAPKVRPRIVKVAKSTAAMESRSAPVKNEGVAGVQQAAATGGDQASGLGGNYEFSLLSWLERHKRYPQQARIRNLEGSGVVYLKLDRGGRVLDFNILESTNYQVLDDEMRAMVQRATPFPAFPSDSSLANSAFRIPITFMLR